jgi:hypothetical protein
MMLTATRIAALFLVVTLPIAGCASRASQSPSAMTKTPDVGTLVGTWDGYMRGTGGASSPIQVKVNPDGTYTSQMGSESGSGTFRVVDGQVVTQGHLSGPAFGSDRQSVVKVADKGGRPVLVGEGRNEAGPYSFELTKRN